MKSELLMKSPLLALPLVALFFFLLVFVVVLIGTMRRKSYEPVAALPLEEEDGQRHKHEEDGR
jgi:hypothetical protein